MPITTSRYEKDLIRAQVERIGAKRMLEIGSFKGQTTAIMSDAAGPDGLVVAIDPMQWASKAAHIWEWIDGLLHPFSYEKSFWANLRRKSRYPENVKLMRHLSTDEALLVSDNPLLCEFDLIFIDGDHTYPGVSRDWDNWAPRVRAGGLVLLHDYCQRFAGVRQKVDELRADERFRIELPTRGTVAVVEVLEPLPALSAAEGLAESAAPAASHGQPPSSTEVPVLGQPAQVGA